MKKILYSSLILGSAFALASCSADEPTVNAGDGKTIVRVSLPGAETRALGDEIDCTELIYTIYDVEGNVVYDNVAVPAFEGHATEAEVEIQLVPGEDYTAIFYAHNTDSKFSSYDSGVISVDYSNINPNEEKDDAFYVKQDITASADGVSVTLKRAFAQLNFCTNDLENAAVQSAINRGVLSTSLEISGGIYSTLDLNAETPEVADAATLGKITSTVAGAVDKDFPEAGYASINSLYLLTTKAEKTLLSGTYTVDNGATQIRNVNLENVPVQMNYRTNITGQLLSSNVPVTITIDPIFEGFYEVPGWDGKEIAEPEVNPENANEVLISTPEQLAGFSQNVNNGNTYSGKTIVLTSDINLNNQPWTPIGTTNLYYVPTTERKPFCGTFDGQGHTIYNLRVEYTGTSEYYGVGLFGQVGTNEGSGYVKNVNVENATIDGGISVGGTGVIAGRIFATASITGCTVNNATVTSAGVLGGLVGFCYGDLKNNTVSKVTVKGGYQAGGLCGRQGEGEGNATWAGYYITDSNIVKGCEISGTYQVGGLIGLVDYGNNIVNNQVINTNITYSYEPDPNIADEPGKYETESDKTSGKLYGRYDEMDGNVNREENNTLTNVTLTYKP